MKTLLDAGAEREYLALVRAFPLLSIRDEAHLEAALERLDQLTEQRELSAAEEAYLGALTDLVETYENAHVFIPPVSGVAALRHLMEEDGLKQRDLAPLFGSPSIISEVLSGKRRLALSHMGKLADYFGLPISVFSAPEPTEAAQFVLSFDALKSAWPHQNEQSVIETLLRDLSACMQEPLSAVQQEALASLFASLKEGLAAKAPTGQPPAVAAPPSHRS